MSTPRDLGEFKKDAIIAARDLGYKNEYIVRVKNAKSEGEVNRIMVTARRERFK